MNTEPSAEEVALVTGMAANRLSRDQPTAPQTPSTSARPPSAPRSAADIAHALLSNEDVVFLIMVCCESKTLSQCRLASHTLHDFATPIKFACAFEQGIEGFFRHPCILDRLMEQVSPIHAHRCLFINDLHPQQGPVFPLPHIEREWNTLKDRLGRHIKVLSLDTRKLAAAGHTGHLPRLLACFPVDLTLPANTELNLKLQDEWVQVQLVLRFMPAGLTRLAVDFFPNTRKHKPESTLKQFLEAASRRVPALQQLRINTERLLDLDKKGVQAIIAAIQRMPSLVQIELSRSLLTPELIEEFRNCVNIRHIVATEGQKRHADSPYCRPFRALTIPDEFRYLPQNLETLFLTTTPYLAPVLLASWNVHTISKLHIDFPASSAEADDIMCATEAIALHLHNTLTNLFIGPVESFSYETVSSLSACSRLTNLSLYGRYPTQFTQATFAYFVARLPNLQHLQVDQPKVVCEWPEDEADLSIVGAFHALSRSCPRLMSLCLSASPSMPPEEDLAVDGDDFNAPRLLANIETCVVLLMLPVPEEVDEIEAVKDYVDRSLPHDCARSWEITGRSELSQISGDPADWVERYKQLSRAHRILVDEQAADSSLF